MYKHALYELLNVMSSEQAAGPAALRLGAAAAGLGLVRWFCDGVGAGWLTSITIMEVNCSLQHRNGSEVNNACVYKAPGDSYLRCRGNALSRCSSLFVLILGSRDSVTPVFGAALEEKQGRRPVKWKAFNQ